MDSLEAARIEFMCQDIPALYSRLKELMVDNFENPQYYNYYLLAEHLSGKALTTATPNGEIEILKELDEMNYKIAEKALTELKQDLPKYENVLQGIEAAKKSFASMKTYTEKIVNWNKKDEIQMQIKNAYTEIVGDAEDHLTDTSIAFDES